MLNIRTIKLDDLPVIAKLHIDHMPLTFPPSRYYLNLMKLIYSYFLDNKKGICYVATIDSEIIGYVCLLKFSKKIFISAFKNYPVAFCYNGIMLLLRFPIHFIKGAPRVLKSFLVARPTKHKATANNDLAEEYYELRPIVVKKDKQGSSVAKILISCGENSLKNRDEKKYFLRVRKDNFRAIAFYKKIGFTPVRDENIRIVMAKNVK